jgi:hypothetical protein
MLLFYRALLDSHRKNLVALGSESCSFFREVTFVFRFISERSVQYCIGTALEDVHVGGPLVESFWATDCS